MNLFSNGMGEIMKNAAIVTLLLLFTATALNCSERFNVERMGVNFNGVCHSGKSVVAYGDGGIILFSYDKGRNWTQKKIFADSVIIKKMVSDGSLYFGYCTNGLLFSLDEEGKVLKSQPADSISDIAVGKNNVFLLMKKKDIIVYDRELNAVFSVDYDFSLNGQKIIFFRDKLFLSTGSAQIISFDCKNSYKQHAADISSYGSYAASLTADTGYIYAKISDTIYRSSDGVSFSPASQRAGVFNVSNGEVFTLSIRQNSKWKASWLECYKTGFDMTSTKLTNDSIRRYANPKVTSFEFIDNSTIVAVGPCKTIYLSSDRGSNWELISNVVFESFSFGRVFWTDKQVGYYTYKAQIFWTTNAGTTWLPQLFTDTLYRNFTSASGLYFDEAGKGFVYHGWSDTYSDTLKNRNILCSYDGGDSYSLSYIDVLSINNTEPNLPIRKTKSGYQIVISPRSYSLTKNRYTWFVNLDSNFKYIDTYQLDSIKAYGLHYDDGIMAAIAAENRYYIDSAKKYDSTKVWLIRSSDEGKTWQNDFQVDINPEESINFEIWNGQNIFYYQSKVFYDSVNNKYTVRYKFHYLNSKEKTNITYLSDSIYGNNTVFYFNNKIYIKHRLMGYLCSSSLLDGSPSWDNVYFPETRGFSLPNHNSFWSDDSVIYARAQYTDDSTNIVKLTPMETNEVKEDETEGDNIYLYAGRPYPQPANERVHLVIYELSNEDISTANINVFDCLGNKINNNSDIERILYSSYNGEIIWNCNSVPTGIYIIRVAFGSSSIGVPVVVVK